MTVRRAAFATAAAVWLIFVSTAGGSLTTSDAVIQFEVARSLVDRGTTAIPASVVGTDAARGVDGRQYSFFGIGQSLYDVPFYATARLLERAGLAPRGKPDIFEKAVVAMGNTIAAAAVVALAFVFAYRLSGDAGAARFAALALAFGTLLWPYAKFGFNAPITALLLTSAAYFAWRGRDGHGRALAASGLSAGAGWLVRHEFPITAAAIACWIAFGAAGGTPLRERLRRLAAFAPGVIAGGLLWAAYNQARFGRPFYTGYTPAFDAAGYAAFLVAPGGALWLYSPIVIAGAIALVHMRHDHRAFVTLVLTIAAAWYAFFGALEDWNGGRSYGPRYLVPLLPMLCVPLGVLWRDAAPRGRRWLVAAACVSALVQIPGVAVDYAKVSQAFARDAAPDAIAARNYRWASSPLALNAAAAWRATPINAAHLLGTTPRPAIRAAASADDHTFSQQFAFSLDFWWLYLFYLGAISGATAILAGAIPFALGAAWLAASRRAAVHSSARSATSGR